MIQQKVRKKKRPVLILIQAQSESDPVDCPVYSKQTNKMWSLKSLVTLKYESRTSQHAVQFN